MEETGNPVSRFAREKERKKEKERIAACFPPCPLRPAFTSSEKRNEPESFFCQSVGSAKVYVAQRSPGQIAFPNGRLPGAKGALRENDSGCRSAVNAEGSSPSPPPPLHPSPARSFHSPSPSRRLLTFSIFPRHSPSEI